MPFYILLALATTAATPVKDATEPAPVVAKAEPAKDKADMDPMKAMVMMMNVFDKFFPAGPEPDPARLAVARQATMTMFPKGAYAQAINGFVNQTTDRVLNMSEADLAAMFPEEFNKKNKNDKKDKKKSGPPSTEPLRVSLSKKDPNFDAKLAAIRAFAGVMFVKLGDVAEPKFRDGMARALARKFDDRQLGEIQAFLATPTGAAYGREMVGLWFQPEVMRGSLQLMPDLITMFPDLVKDGAAFDAQMKALDKPASSKKKD